MLSSQQQGGASRIVKTHTYASVLYAVDMSAQLAPTCLQTEKLKILHPHLYIIRVSKSVCAVPVQAACVCSYGKLNNFNKITLKMSVLCTLNILLQRKIGCRCKH